MHVMSCMATMLPSDLCLDSTRVAFVSRQGQNLLAHALKLLC